MSSNRIAEPATAKERKPQRRRSRTEIRADATMENSDVQVFIALVRRVMGIPPEGFGDDDDAISRWDSTAHDDAGRTAAVMRRHPEWDALARQLPLVAPDPTASIVLDAAAVHVCCRLAYLGERYLEWAENAIVAGVNDVRLVAPWITHADDGTAVIYVDPDLPKEELKALYDEIDKRRRSVPADARIKGLRLKLAALYVPGEMGLRRLLKTPKGQQYITMKGLSASSEGAQIRAISRAIEPYLLAEVKAEAPAHKSRRATP